MQITALFFMYFSKLFYLANTYENFALNKQAWQQHRYFAPHHYVGADRAVDGKFDDLSSYGEECTRSDNSRATAEWRVDLGEVLSIHHVFIQYLTGNAVWDENSTFASQFLGFSLYISNTTTKEDGVLCFKDTNYSLATIPNPVNISCHLYGRYVIYYNNRTHFPFPAGYSNYAYNELCEVEVYGCPNSSYFGENCAMPCGRNCLEGKCDVVDGTCIGCVTGHTGPTCMGCVPGYTGSTCDTGGI